ncbi:MAG: hypothetical protein KC550_04505 [Nanoarchaeota archaeon]|nr:hypothetical protein [Nanoarchaeota archaeon]
MKTIHADYEKVKGRTFWKHLQYAINKRDLFYCASNKNAFLGFGIHTDDEYISEFTYECTYQKYKISEFNIMEIPFSDKNKKEDYAELHSKLDLINATNTGQIDLGYIKIQFIQLSNGNEAFLLENKYVFLVPPNTLDCILNEKTFFNESYKKENFIHAYTRERLNDYWLVIPVEKIKQEAEELYLKNPLRTTGVFKDSKLCLSKKDYYSTRDGLDNPRPSDEDLDW